MKKFFKSFYGKLSAIFLVILLILGTVQTFITMQSSQDYIAEVDQKLNLDLASSFAKELKPLMDADSLNYSAIGERIHYMMVMNPKMEIYLLDGDGNILSFFAKPGKEVRTDSVNLEPIHQFIASKQHIPILGQDPRFPAVRKPFSASKIQLPQGRDGYIYIVIGGEDYTATTASTRESYIFNTLLKAMILTIALAAIAGLILFALLTKRLRNMAAAVKNFKEGDYSQRIDDDSDDEIGELASSFNQMADTIVANMAELKQTDQLRRELVANVSHDLRSPLASIQGYLETIMMKDRSLEPDRRKEFLHTILGETESLNKLVHELFELSKLDAREKAPHPEKFSMEELVQDVVAKFQDKAEKSGISLNAFTPGELPPVYADIGMIERVLSNLIGNAIEYTPEGGKVDVAIEQKNGEVLTSVDDNGPGIPEEDLPHIFERFYRVEKSRTRNNGSTGLGLAIAKKMIDLHNGDISVSSRLGEGTKFRFSLDTASNN